MNQIDLSKYNFIIGYGVGEYYERIKKELFQNVKFDYLCDRKWEGTDCRSYDGISIISKDKIKELKNVLVIIIIEKGYLYYDLKTGLEAEQVDVVHANQLIRSRIDLTGAQLKEQYPDGHYSDEWGNEILFDSSLPDNIVLWITGKNNKVTFGKNLAVMKLTIWLGNNGVCRIGDYSEFIETMLYVADASVIIGEDCLFSDDVCIRTSDGHHIFDLVTKKRINYAKNIRIGHHVWVTRGVTLLGGAEIGTGSVVGTKAVTSGKFGKHQVIAGVPARAIRENVCWSRDCTQYVSYDFLEECMDKGAIDYIGDERE